MINAKALKKAQSRIRVCQSALTELESCNASQVFGDKWYVFLVAAKSVYTALEIGSKTTAQSRQWFGGKNAERKADPLLRYITEARNDVEHGLEESTIFVPNKVAIGVSAPGMSSRMRDAWGNVFENGGTAIEYIGNTPKNLPLMQSLDGLPILVKTRAAHMTLTRVHDRSGNSYEPPTSHLGQKLEDCSPVAVAKAMMAYLEAMLIEAAQLSASAR